VVLVVSILVVIAGISVPTFFREMQRERLPGSAAQLRTLLSLVRANASFDGRRYRFRFPSEGEEDPLGGLNQPVIEREDDPLREPEVFNLVTAPWAFGKTLHDDVWCAEVRIGRPTIEDLQQRRNRIEERVTEELEEFEALQLPLFVEPDGTSPWVTFVLTLAPRGTDVEQLEDHPTLEVIYDGSTGLAWVQRPFYEEELDLFEEKNWPAVLRQDFTNEAMLTEDNVLELRDFHFTR
jgi:hypothetical protein